MVTQPVSKLSSHDRRVTIPPKLWAALVFYANDERGRIESKEVKALITPESLAVEVLTNRLTQIGHYPPKDGAGKKPVAPVQVGS